MIELIGVSKEFGTSSKQIALKNINLQINTSGCVVIYGTSGSGKTTLLNCISQIDNPTSGVIKGIKKEDVSFIFQDYALFNDMSIEMNLELARGNDSNIEIDELLSKVHVNENKKKKINELSGGQKQRVAIAKALIANRNVIIADEPTGNLDSNNSIAIAEELKSISENKLVIVVTHDKELFQKYADRMIEIRDGEIVSDQTINRREDIQFKTNNNRPKIKAKSVFSIFKAANKSSISRLIFGVVITFLALFSISIWLNIAFTSKHSLIKNSVYKTNIPAIAFSKKVGMQMSENDYIVANDICNGAFVIHDCSYSDVYISLYDDNSQINYIYETSTSMSNVAYGSNKIGDNEIILSYSIADYISGLSGIEIKNLIGKDLTIKGKIYKLVGIDQKTNGVAKKSGYEDVNEKYDLEKNYCYMNKNTYESFRLSDGYLRFGTEYSINNKIYLNTSVQDFELEIGTKDISKNEIVLSTNNYRSICCTSDDYEDLLNVTYTFSFKCNGGYKEYKLKIVGFGNYTMVNEETFNSLIEYSTNYNDDVRFSKVGVFVSDLTKGVLKKFESKDFEIDYFLSESVYSTKSTIGYINLFLLFVSIPMILIMFLYLISFSKQNIVSKKREIGILKSMSFSNKEISKIFIIDTLFLILISFLLTFIVVPVGISIINDLFYGSFAFFKVINNNYIYIIMLIILMISTFMFSLYINLHKLNKKADVDLVYGR